MIYDYEFYKKSADYVLESIDFKPEIAIILGTALGGITKVIENPIEIPYNQIPNFLVSTAEHHAGKLVLGTYKGKKVVCMSGRFHYYEGYSFEQLAAPIRLFKLLGVEKTILTNASGAVNPNYNPGDVMIIKDHINLMGAAPTRGKNIPELGEMFYDVTDIYTKTLRDVAKECAKKTTLTVHEGVYQYFSGPHFETPAEIRAARILGADAVGMSTVTEALTAAHCKMPILAISLLTNMASGVRDEVLCEGEVEEIAEASEEAFCKYIVDVLECVCEKGAE
jgi:purine-nucleoside phosphorylase